MTLRGIKTGRQTSVLAVQACRCWFFGTDASKTNLLQLLCPFSKEPGPKKKTKVNGPDQGRRLIWTLVAERKKFSCSQSGFLEEKKKERGGGKKRKNKSGNDRGEQEKTALVAIKGGDGWLGWLGWWWGVEGGGHRQEKIEVHVT